MTEFLEREAGGLRSGRAKPAGSAVEKVIDGLTAHAYTALDGDEGAERFGERHGIESAAILTVYEDERARLITDYLCDRIHGKTVVEIGAGVGFLSVYLAACAERVFAIEAFPAWAWVYVNALHERKPKNLTFIFGAAEEVASFIRADVAVFCTHSGHDAMRRAASLFAPEVIDVYGEILSARAKAGRLTPEESAALHASRLATVLPPVPPKARRT